MSLHAKRLAEEGNAVAAILLFWYVLGAIVQFSPALGSTIGDAGVVMAVLYVAVRGGALSAEVLPLETGSVAVVLLRNLHVALAASVWFLAAAVVYVINQSFYFDVIGAVAAALAGAGLGVVGIYAVAAGYATFRRNDATAGVPADD